MIKLSRILKDYKDSGALNALVNVHAAVDDHTFLTKSGDLLMILSLKGVDAECMDISEIDSLARRFEAATRLLGEEFTLYQYLLKRDRPDIPHRRHENPVVQEAVANRMAYLATKARQLNTVEIYFALVYQGWYSQANLKQNLFRLLREPQVVLADWFSTRAKLAVLDTELVRACENLRNKAMSFVVQLPDAFHAEVLDKSRAFRFLRRLLNYAPYKADTVRLRYDSFVDFQACDSALECYRDHLRLDDFYVQILTLKEPPAQTFAQMLQGLQKIRSKFVIASQWKRQSPWQMRKLIQSKRRHFHNSKSSLMNYLGQSGTAPKDMLIDDSAMATVAQLGHALEELEVNGRFFGEFSMTLVLYDEDRAALSRSVAECFKVFAAHDAVLTEERYNLLNAWLAVLPGNAAHNLRTLWLSNTNHADLSFLFAGRTGEQSNEHLAAEYLSVLETTDGMPYYLNLHYQDNAHTSILGSTGSGKSFTLNFLLTDLQKYQPLTYIFDLGGSYENLTRLFGGSYLAIGAEKRPFTINPFSLSPTKENHQFQFSLVKVLIESSGYQMDAVEERDLYEQIGNLYAIAPDQRRLNTLANIVKRSLRLPLQKWVQGGQYGAWFDNVSDSLALAPFQTFDFERTDHLPQVLEAVLFYVLYRVNEAIYDPAHAATLKIFVVDEAWRLWRNPVIKLHVQEALKTWRKKNAAMILATQSAEDLLRSDMLAVIAESCATKMFLANPGMDQAAYRTAFHLNERETQLIAGLTPKQQILIKRPDGSKVVHLTVDPKSYWLYTNSPFESQKRREAFERHGFKEGLEILARSSS